MLEKIHQRSTFRAKMHQDEPLLTPMTNNIHLSKHKGEAIQNEKEYRSIVRALQYATITRPEISFSVNKVYQFMHQPLIEHWRAVKIILRYLNGTIDYIITLKESKNITITRFYDADWASDPDDRRSTTGHCIFLGECPMSWCLRKQPTISRSSIELQYRSLASMTIEMMWLESLLSELKVEVNKSTIWCDNLRTVSLIANPILHSRTNYMELDLYFVREQVDKGRFNINRIPALYQ